MTEQAELYRRELEDLKSARTIHDSVWQKAYDYTYPERGYGFNGTEVFTANDVSGKRRRIFDDTAADSVRSVAANFVSSTTPRNAMWIGFDAGFDTTADSADDEVTRYLDNAARIIHENLQASNFYDLIFDCAIDLIVGGWPILFSGEAPQGGYTFEQWPCGECYIAASMPNGPIDIIYRVTTFTVRQLVNKYGEGKVSPSTLANWQNSKHNEKVVVCHAIKPRSNGYVEGAVRSEAMRFESCHLEIANKHVLTESGYHEFPCMVPRMSLIPGTHYALGMVDKALGSILSLNKIKEMEEDALSVAVSGMWIAVDDGILNPNNVKIGPKKILAANSVDSMKELRSGSDFNVTFSAEERLQAAIRRSLMADQLQPQDGPDMTAYEVSIRVQIVRQMLGPMTARFEAELRRMVDRLFMIALRAGVLGPAPEALGGVDITPQFYSPLARAQRMEEIQAMDRMETTIMNQMQVDPSVADIYDYEQADRVRGDSLGVPKKVIRTQDAIDKIRDARKESQEQAQQQAAMQQMATTGGEAAIKQAVAA